jgi:pyruvate/2-oxoglutarate dehydrogenase complex dihydrolipoamide acyltransferase (E2) component
MQGPQPRERRAVKRVYRPKEDVEGLTLTFPNAVRGETVDITEWPYETEDAEEQRFLASHELVEEVESQEATEAAVRKAQELGVDLANVEGTGSDGKITVKDVEDAAKDKEGDS